MRYFRFIAKNLGRERYLTYVMGEGMDFDEDVLDYCEENEIPEILNIIYEEDDDFDYLTYDISGKMTVAQFTQGVMDEEKVFKLLRNISMAMISVKEHAIPLSYIILNKEYMYINPDTMDIEFLYLPVENEDSVATQFKTFVRQLVAGFVYNVEEDLAYVGQLLTYINGNSFNLRGLIGLTEAIMQDSSIDFGNDSGISTDDGAEVVNTVDAPEVTDEKSAMDFMNDLGEAGDLPEIGGDDEEAAPEDMAPEAEAPESGIELSDASEPVETALHEELEELPAEEKVDEPQTETLEELAHRLQDLAIEAQHPEEKKKKEEEEKSVSVQKPVRVSRAAMLKAAAETIEEEAEEAAAEAAAEEEKKDSKDKKAETAEAKEEEEKKAAQKKQKAPEIVDNTILGNTGTIKINPYLVRVNTDEKTVINKPVFKIGKASRGVDYHISGNGAISRQHAIILHKGDSYYIKDNKSTNRTYVDNVAVEGDNEVLLKNNCTITLGDEDFTFKIS